jgi:ATP-binding cassette subfamily B protein
MLIRYFFDSLSDGAAVSFGPYTLCGFLVTAAVGRSLFIYIDVPIFFSAHFRSCALLRKNLIEAILDRPGAKALPDSTGEAISRFRGDVDTISNYMGSLPFLVGNILFSVVAFYVMFQIDVRISLIVFAPFVLAIVIINYSQHRIRRFREASREAAGKVTGFVAELFEDALAIRLTNTHDRMIERLENLGEIRRAATLKDILLSRILDSLIWNTTNVGTGVILILAGPSMQTGAFSVGDFALFVFYLGWTSMLVQGTARTLAQYKQTGVSIERALALTRVALPKTSPGTVTSR